MSEKSFVAALASVVLSLFFAGATFAQDITISSNTAWPEGVYRFDNVTVNSGAILTIAGGSTINVAGTVTVTGGSTILLQGKNTSAQVDGQWAGVGVTINAADIQIDAGCAISADGQGYVTQNRRRQRPGWGDRH